MTRRLWALAMVLLAALSGCGRARPMVCFSLVDWAARYRAADSDDERDRLFTHIRKAFEDLERTGSEAHRTQLPGNVLDMLMDEIALPGPDRGNPWWGPVYSCGGFLYVTEFTCDVKHIIGGGSPTERSWQKEEWYPDYSVDCLFFDNELVLRYPLSPVN